jgi:hypothetical protein
MFFVLDFIVPLCSYLNGSADIHSSHLSIFYVNITWRWPPIGAESSTKNIVEYSGLKKIYIIPYSSAICNWNSILRLPYYSPLYS